MVSIPLGGGERERAESCVYFFVVINVIFVGFEWLLSLSLSTETLDSYFSEFGDIVERTIMKDQTGRSR